LAQNLNQAFVKNYKYVTKEAAQEHTDIIGEDFMTFLGENHCKTPMTFIKDYVIKIVLQKLKLGCVKHHDLRYCV
jgi:cell division transport system permease protein